MLWCQVYPLCWHWWCDCTCLSVGKGHQVITTVLSAVDCCRTTLYAGYRAQGYDCALENSDVIVPILLLFLYFFNPAPSLLLFNPWHMCKGYGSCSVCVRERVCLLRGEGPGDDPDEAICYCASCYIPRVYIENMSHLGFSNIHCTRISLKTLCSKVLATFADRLCLFRFLTSSWWTKQTVMAALLYMCRSIPMVLWLDCLTTDHIR